MAIKIQQSTELAQQILDLLGDEISFEDAETKMNAICVALINLKQTFQKAVVKKDAPKVDLMLIRWLMVLDKGLAKFIDTKAFEEAIKNVSE